jgi:hypothetical protein
MTGTHITQIQVTATDNELILLASTAAGSSELCRLKSGFNKPVSYTLFPQAILPPGDYDLTVIGINWGGPWAFKVTTTPAIGGLSGSGPGPAPGVAFFKSVPINV